jgi:hypothetical protein
MKTMHNKNSILADIFLQPWFLPMQTASAIRRLIPPEHRHKMRAFFDDYGCLRCSQTAVRYGSNGMCESCVQEVKLKLLFAIKRRWVDSSPPQLGCHYVIREAPNFFDGIAVCGGVAS